MRPVATPPNRRELQELLDEAITLLWSSGPLPSCDHATKQKWREARQRLAAAAGTATGGETAAPIPALLARIALDPAAIPNPKTQTQTLTFTNAIGGEGQRRGVYPAPQESGSEPKNTRKDTPLPS